MNRKMKICRNHVGAGVVLASLMLATALIAPHAANSQPRSGEKIRIGLFTPLTGSMKDFGLHTTRGVEMAFKEINARGGIRGKKLELVIQDTGSQTGNVPHVVSRLIKEEKVLALIGDVASSSSLAAAPIAQFEKVPMISPAATHPRVTQAGDYVFRTCFVDPFQGTAMARFARRSLKKKTAALFVDSSTDYSRGLAENFEKEWRRSGGQIVSQQTYSGWDKGFRGQLKLIKAAKPDVIYVPGYYNDAVPIVVQARQLGMKQILLGGDGWNSANLIGTKVIQGSYFTEHFAADNPDARVRRFVEHYRQTYKAAPDSIDASGYDAARVLANAIERAVTWERSDLRDALANTKSFPGVTGNITIDDSRNAIKPVAVLRIVEGKAKFAATVRP